MNIKQPRVKINLPKNRFLSSKSHMTLLFVMFISWIAVITYSDMSDYKVYYDDYYRIMNVDSAILTRNYEIGFYVAMFFPAKLHLPFEVFYGVYMSIAMLILGKFINANAKHKAFVWMLCILLPFIYYLQQIRSTMATMIIFHAVGYLANSNEKRWKKTLKYLSYCVIASLFQQTSLIYISFILALYIGKTGLKRFVIIVNVTVPVILHMMFPLLVKGLRILFRNHWMIDEYLSAEFVVQKYTFFVVGIFLIFYLVFLYIDNVGVDKNKENLHFEFYYKVSLIICMLAPLSYFTVLADRIVTMAIPIVYVTIDRYAVIIKRRYDKVIASTACLIFAIVYLAFLIGPWNPQNHNRLFHEMWKSHPKDITVTYITQ